MRPTRELAVDERGRCNLSRVCTKPAARYLVEAFPDGTLVLTPAVTVSALELAALNDRTVRAAVKAAR